MLVRSLKKIFPFLFSKSDEKDKQQEVLSSTGQNQFYSVVPLSDKIRAIDQLIKQGGVNKSVIFCSRKRDVYLLQRYLRGCGYFVKSIFHTREKEVIDQICAGFHDKDNFHLVVFDNALESSLIGDTEYVFHFDMPISLDVIKMRYDIFKAGSKINTTHYVLIEKEKQQIPALNERFKHNILFLDLPIEQIEGKSAETQTRDAGETNKKKSYPKRFRHNRYPLTARRSRRPRGNNDELPDFIKKPATDKKNGKIYS